MSLGLGLDIYIFIIGKQLDMVQWFKMVYLKSKFKHDQTLMKLSLDCCLNDEL